MKKPAVLIAVFLVLVALCFAYVQVREFCGMHHNPIC